MSIQSEPSQNEIVHANSIDVYDVFVVFDESDDFARDEILSFLDSENISFLCMERNGDPGNTIFEDFRNLAVMTKKVLFVISNHFCQNGELIFLSTMTLDIVDHNTQKIITLLTDGVISDDNGLFCLNATTKISINNQHWKEEVAEAIKKVCLKFCKLLKTGEIADYLLMRGLSLVNLNMEVHGLIIFSRKRYLKVDLAEYSKHLDIHHKYNTCYACQQFGFLSDTNTTINLSLRCDFSSDQLADINDDLIKLCVGLLSTYRRKHWLFVCSVSGTYEKKQNEFIADLFAKAKFAIEVNASGETGVPGKPYLPEYISQEKRLESFKGNWPTRNVPTSELMAKSGFAFMRKPAVARCFACGYMQHHWDTESDPLFVHAQTAPSCSFVRENLAPEKFPKEQIKLLANNDAFLSEQSRHDSLKSFQIGEVLNSFDIDDKELTIREMAQSGFYDMGYGMIRCFSCGVSISLKGLEEDFDVWNLHGSLSPNCKYLLEQMGEKFVKSLNRIQRRNADPTIATFFILSMDSKGNLENHIQRPGCVFYPGDRVKLDNAK